MASDLGFIHRFVPGDDPAAPTLLLLHGTGGSEEDLLGVGRAIAPHSALLSPRGKSLDEGMPRFFRRFGEGRFDEKDILFRAGELAEFVSSAAITYAFNPARVIALGYSNGANIAAAMMLLHPASLAGGMLLRSMLPLVPQSPPDLAGKSVLMCSAQNDPIVSIETVQQLSGLLEKSGAEVTLQWFNTGHGLSPDDLSACADWVTRQ